MTILDIPPQRNWLNNLKPRKYAAYNYLPPVGLAKGIARLESFFLWTPHVTCSGFVSLTRACTKKIRVGRTPTGGRNELSRNREIKKLKICNALRKKDRPAETAQKKEDWCLSITSPAEELTCQNCPGLFFFLRRIFAPKGTSLFFFKHIPEFIRVFEPLKIIVFKILDVWREIQKINPVFFSGNCIDEPKNKSDSGQHRQPIPIVAEKIRKRDNKEADIEFNKAQDEKNKPVVNTPCWFPALVILFVPFLQLRRFEVSEFREILSCNVIVSLNSSLFVRFKSFVKLSSRLILFGHKQPSFQIGGIPQKGKFLQPERGEGVVYVF